MRIWALSWLQSSSSEESAAALTEATGLAVWSGASEAQPARVKSMRPLSTPIVLTHPLRARGEFIRVRGTGWSVNNLEVSVKKLLLTEEHVSEFIHATNADDIDIRADLRGIRLRHDHAPE